MTLPVLDCRTCGACCMFCRVPPYNLAELAGLPPAVRERVLSVAARHGSDPKPGPCPMYDRATKSCIVYTHRPARCRDFEPGSIGCLNDRRKAGIQ